MFTNDGQLEFFTHKLPQHGYGTDDKRYGLRMYPADLLITKALLQANKRNEVTWLIYDLDEEQAMLEWQDRNCPPPNIVTVNPENGHAHLFYGLEKPVHNNYESSKKALRYLASIDLALTEKLGADPGYSKLISKNPIHPNWLTYFPTMDLYDLEGLSSWLDLAKYQDKRRRLPQTGYGRNCTLFENLRLWAYRERRKPQAYFSQDMFFEAVVWRGLALNADFKPPLPHAEVRATAKSISKWTWRNMSEAGFKAWHKKQSEYGNKIKTAKSLDLRRQIQETINTCPGLTQQDIAHMHSVTRETVNRHVRAIKDSVTFTISDRLSVTFPISDSNDSILSYPLDITPNTGGADAYM